MYRNLGNTPILMYNFLGFLSLVIVLIYNLLHYKLKLNFFSIQTKKWHHYCYKRPFIWIYKKLSRIETWVIIEIILISIIQGPPGVLFARLLGNILSTGANYFGYVFFIPYLLFFFCTAIKIDPLRQIDLITPAFAIALCISKLGCFCAGCCNGIEYANGLYNYSTAKYEFPIQLVEAAIALFIFFFLLIIKNKVKTGTLFPIYLICYSSTRFFSEFMRHEDNVLGILKFYHFLCLIGVFVGLIEYYFISKYNIKIQAYFNNKWKHLSSK